MSSRSFYWVYLIAAASACGGSEFSPQTVEADAGPQVDASADSSSKDSSAGASGSSGAAGAGGTSGGAGAAGAAGITADAGCSSPSDCGLGYACLNGSCATSCSDDQACAEGYFCISSQCVLKLTQGSQCTTAGQCASSYCVDGVCCESECTGKCMRCKGENSATPGQCRPILKAQDPDNECAGEKTCDGNGSCGGTWVCGCDAKEIDVHATCCGGQACGVCTASVGTCKAKQGTACFEKNGIETGTIGAGSGVADNACPSGWRCASWECTCTY